MRILELFAGTGSVGEAMATHWPDAEIISLDITPDNEPTICTDITQWDYFEYQPGYFDVIWASPPCQFYSRAAYRTKTDRTKGDRTAKLTFDIINYFEPKAWFVENPATGKMHTRDWAAQYEMYRDRCTYCKYGTKYMKATSIWTNMDVDLKVCKPGSRCEHYVQREGVRGYHPETSQKGPSRAENGRVRINGHPTSTLWRVPANLVIDLCRAVDEN